MNIFVCFDLLVFLVAGLHVALGQETSMERTDCSQREVCTKQLVRRLDGLQNTLHDQKLHVEQLFSSMAERFQSQLLLLLQSQQQIQRNQQIQQQQLLDQLIEQFNQTMLNYQQQLDGRLSILQSQQTQLIESKTQQLDERLLQIQQKLATTSQSTGNIISLPRDCMDVKANGNAASGVYTIYVDSCQRPMSVYCDMVTDGGGWLVFQRRQDGSVDFYRSWVDYASGFGNLAGEFWLGNNLLHALTSGKSYRLKIDLQDFNDTVAYAEYSNFAIGSAQEKYKLTSVGTFSGTPGAGDSLTGHVGHKFSTFDQDNDLLDSGKCAVTYKGAWWYSSCHSSNLNGLYLNGSHVSYADGIEWYTWTGHYYSLQFTEMKIKPTIIP